MIIISFCRSIYNYFSVFEIKLTIMKKIISLIAILSIALTSNSQTLKPYILGSTYKSDIKSQVNAGLEGAGFTVVGEYMPVEDASRWVMIVSHPALDNAVKSIGGLTGFASTL